MDAETIKAIMAFAGAALPFVVAGIVWLQKKLSDAYKQIGLSDVQGDLLLKLGEAMYAVVKEKVKDDPSKAEKLAFAEMVLGQMKETWEDPDGTNKMMEGLFAQFEAILQKV